MGCLLRVPFILLGLCLVISPLALAEMKVQQFVLDIEVAGEGESVGMARPDVELVLASPDQRVERSGPFVLYAVATEHKDSRKRALLSYSFTTDGWKPEWQQALDPNVALLQLHHDRNQRLPPRLLGYASGAVIEFDAQSRAFVPKLNAPSGWQFAAQQSDGSFSTLQSFGPEPVMGMGSKRYVYFTAFEPYAFDHNRDGRLDVGFWKDNAMRVYYQDAHGRFAENPVSFSPGVDIVSDAFFSLTVGEDADNPSGRQAILDGIEDLDGDSLPDLLVYSITGEGLFGKETRYEIHLGREGVSGTLEFESKPSSVVGSGGIQIDVDRQDLDGDGQMEMIITSFNLGLGSIVRGLLSRSANLDLSIYRLQDGRYPEKPNVRRRITAKLDLSEGEVFVPAVLAGDVNGDGFKDLLVQNGSDELRVYAGIGSHALFEKSAINLQMALPLSSGKIEVLDIDNDGDDDLLAQFPANAEADTPPKVVALVFEGEL